MRDNRFFPPRAIEIELDEWTAERLQRLAACCEDDPRRVAASLLHDILRDDEETNCLGAPVDPRHIN